MVKSVVSALDQELVRLRLGEQGLVVAASARVLAERLDDDATSGPAAAALAKELREHLAALRELAPERPDETQVGRIAGRARAKLKVAADD